MSIWVAFSDRTYWIAERSSNVVCFVVTPRPFLEERLRVPWGEVCRGKDPPGYTHFTPHFTAFYSTFYWEGGPLDPGERVGATLGGPLVAPHGLESLGLQPAGR